jgi:hypothetical protein
VDLHPAFSPVFATSPPLAPFVSFSVFPSQSSPTPLRLLFPLPSSLFLYFFITSFALSSLPPPSSPFLALSHKSLSLELVIHEKYGDKEGKGKGKGGFHISKPLLV